MAYALEFAFYALGWFVALAAVFNLYSRRETLLGQLVVGAVGLIVACLVSGVIRGRMPRRVTTGGLLLIGVVMVLPAAWRLFSTNRLSAAEATVAALGLLLGLVSFLRIERE